MKKAAFGLEAPIQSYAVSDATGGTSGSPNYALSDSYDDFDSDTGETSSTLNERVTYWPSIPTSPAKTRRRPDWLWYDPLETDLSLEFASEYPELASLLGEVYAALDNKLHI